MQDVVFTGIGIACPLGIGREEVWSAIENRRSGIRLLDDLVATSFPTPIGAEVLNFEPKQYVKPRKSLKVMARETQLGFTAARLAWEDAGLADSTLDPERLGVVVGANNIRSRLDELVEVYRATCEEGQFDMKNWGEGMRDMYPLWMLKYLANMVCCHIGISLDARGPINTILEGEVSSLLAIIEAADVIARGHADIMIAGGSSTMLGMVDQLWRGGLDMSHNTDNPAEACRPFDARRDGSVAGEGAAMFILESREHAQRRGAAMQAHMLGYGRRCEPSMVTLKPTGQAIRQAIEAALVMGDVEPSEIGHVNAHGNGTIDDDATEARAIQQVLRDVPVTAPKSFIGNSGEGSGAIELAISLLGMRKGITPPTLNYDQPDPACPVNVVSQAQPSQSPNLLAINHKRTGQAVSLLVRAE